MLYLDGKIQNSTDESIKDFLTQKGNFAYICIENCGNVTDEGIKVIVNRCPELFRLELVNCPNITDAGIKHLAGCHEFWELNLKNVLALQDQVLKIYQQVPIF